VVWFEASVPRIIGPASLKTLSPCTYVLRLLFVFGLLALLVVI